MAWKCVRLAPIKGKCGEINIGLHQQHKGVQVLAQQSCFYSARLASSSRVVGYLAQQAALMPAAGLYLAHM